MDSDGFVEKCRFCGGRVVEVKKTKTKCYFFSFKNDLKVKKCSRCQRILEEKDIVFLRPSETLGWAPI